jgi:hypothetical protein
MNIDIQSNSGGNLEELDWELSDEIGKPHGGPGLPREMYVDCSFVERGFETSLEPSQEK